MNLPLRLVLDTQVWLDWLVFHDPDVKPITTVIKEHAARVFISPACEAELERVLAYPLSAYTLDAQARAAALACCRAITTPLPAAPDADTHENGVAHATVALPRCADPDDQKFLELARDCGAHALITRDNALLSLAHRKRRPLPFCIVTPRAFPHEMQRLAVIR